MSAPAVQLQDIFCVHRSSEGDAAALQGLTLELAPGERLCVLGPSGAGKTTLLRVLAGLQPPSAGSALVFGRDVGRLSSRQRSVFRHQTIGFLDQHAEAALAPDLRVAQSVALPLALRGVPRATRRARVTELLATAGLGDRGDALPGQLSGGERQRVALCAALVHRPRLLLADEPTAELDQQSALAISALIDELAEAERMTVIVVSHDAAMAERAPRVVRIRDGRVVEDRQYGGRSLVVDRGGWLRVPGGLLDAAEIFDRADAPAVPGGVLLTPAGRRSAPTAVMMRGPGAGNRCEPVLVELRAVSRSRGHGAARRAVIEELTLSFAPGRLTVVVGRSGTGKSTLLELLGCLALPDSGELWFDQRPLGRPGPELLAALRRARIGYLQQEPTPVGFLSAEENVALALRIRGHPGSPASESARRALERVGMANRSRQHVQRLSAGEGQRVALARALACANGLLIVDEPTSRLDEANAAAVARLLAQTAADDGQTVICATHDPEVIRHADDVLDLGDRR
jgi:ABC-type lipoprotein export system ATPase subunit